MGNHWKGLILLHLICISVEICLSMQKVDTLYEQVRALGGLRSDPRPRLGDDPQQDTQGEDSAAFDGDTSKIIKAITQTICESSKASNGSYLSTASAAYGTLVLEGDSVVNITNRHDNASDMNNRSRLGATADLRRMALEYKYRSTKTFVKPRNRYEVQFACRHLLANCEEICQKVSYYYCDEFEQLPLCTEFLLDQIPSRCYRYCLNAWRYYHKGDVTHLPMEKWGDISEGK